MRVAYFSVIALVLVSGCSNTKSYTQDISQDYSYMVAIENTSCQTLMTIGGGLKAKCNQ